jgi:hypothetical protein
MGSGPFTERRRRMQVELKDSFDVLQAVADIGDAQIVVNDYSLTEEEIDDDGIVEIFKDLQVRIVAVLARLGLHGEVRFWMDVSPTSKLGNLIKRSLEGAPRSVVITPEFCEQARQDEAEAERQTAEMFKALKKDMRAEGLRRGLDKEQRAKMTLSEFYGWDSE